ncbi:GAF domain-containing sensor histidine kinase [Dyadobacter sp. CY323]|uniref:GAF domain-containing sensor histidine kinase n=1 Tax=Dyadobacter sp. CY323 TaxID=2907302 RepID=UPI001F39F739|nr:GAF domain-containing sensor histidine kinase [Dyadobacter sp. CY323]MCE6993168.1 GAF domain-containing sensor histidine kinase [Dyadobacter sp. CY323]
MTLIETPIPVDELERIKALSDFDLDYSEHQITFKDLAKLAAKVTGTQISLVNLIDSLTQWTISGYGLNIDQMLREDSVCQYTIMEADHFEISDLTADDRFKDKFYVTGAPNVTYYYGIPLKSTNGLNIGALCVMDRKHVELDPEQTELMKIIADEIVCRIQACKTMDDLQAKLSEATQNQKKVAHDIRGPLGGIMGLAQIITEQGESNQMNQVLEFVDLIEKSSRSILDLAEEILDTHGGKASTSTGNTDKSTFNLSMFRDKIETLYGPQAKHKNIHFEVRVCPNTNNLLFSKSKLLQIVGNLISNSMKFTPEEGSVTVTLSLTPNAGDYTLNMTVADSGVGMDDATIASILNGSLSSTEGTGGELGYGFGLALVKQLVAGLQGQIAITSLPGAGTTFEVNLPQKIR